MVHVLEIPGLGVIVSSFVKKVPCSKSLQIVDWDGIDVSPPGRAGEAVRRHWDD